MKASLKHRLWDRWATLIEEDMKEEGLWADVRRHLGLEDGDELTPEHTDPIDRYIKRCAARLRERGPR